MLFLSIYCDNLYMFKDFYVDLTYNKKLSHPLAEDDVLFPESRIKVRKKLILMGGNAAGKTTFGKLLCSICNYILGRSLDIKNGSFRNIEACRFDKKREAHFTVEFAIDRKAFLLDAKFGKDGLTYESLKEKDIYKTYSIETLRDKLKKSSPVAEFNVKTSAFGMGFKSYAFSQKEIVRQLHTKFGFLFLFSQFMDLALSRKSKTKMMANQLNEVLPEIDNSIEKVIALDSADPKIQSLSYMIIFKNGETVTVPDGDVRACAPRLSQGTLETINFVTVLSEIPKRKGNVFFIDEQLVHMHTELESYLIYKAMLLAPRDMQIFFTTHNLEVFQLNLPNDDFILFYRKSGFIYNDALYPADKMSKNDRSLRNYYENDYFGVLPDYGTLDKFFESVKKGA